MPTLRKQRTTESIEERDKRRKRETEEKALEVSAADAAIDAMIKRNIELYGP